MASSKPDVSRSTTSFLGTGLGTVHTTTIQNGNSQYSGTGWTSAEADKKAGDKCSSGERDKKK